VIEKRVKYLEISFQKACEYGRACITFAIPIRRKGFFYRLEKKEDKENYEDESF